MTGALFGAIISDRFGRRVTMFVGCFIIICGSIISAAGHSLATFVVGRFVLGFGVTVSQLGAPAYAMEIAPPQWRGRCTGE